jgi:prepilin-type N-terminal cleavage/methylation domain-containing protein
MRRSALRRNVDAGFTLIELLIVIIILGVLAAIVVLSVSGISDRGKTSACKASISTIDTAAEAYVAKNGGAAGGLTLDNLVAGGFLHSAPTTIGTTTVTGSTTVTTVDGITCP